MGLLTANQLTAIQSGARVRQVWKIYTPRAAGSATFDATTIHDDDGTQKRVVDPGSREHTAYNVSLQEPGKFSIGRYEIGVQNEDGYFCPEKASNVFYNSTGTYQAMPAECDLEHKVYVMYGGSWSELTGVAYRGQIVEVAYEDMASPAGAIGGAAQIVSEARAVAEILEYRFTFDDGDDDDTGADVVGP